MKCRICNAEHLTEVLDLGPQPWCNHFLKEEEVGKEPYYSLKLLFCNDCSCVQIDTTIPKEIMFAEHPYVSDKRIVRKEDADRNIANLKLKRGDFIIDIGGNDGTLLSYYKDAGIRVLNVESAHNIADISRKNGVETITEFFNTKVAEEIVKNYGKANAVSAANVFFHVEELHSITEGIAKCLCDNGTFIVQFIYLPDMLQNLSFDMIYHEHLLYYTITSLQKLLSIYSLEIFDLYHTSVHGGTIVAYAGHKAEHNITKTIYEYQEKEKKECLDTVEPYKKFADKVEGIRDDLVNFVRKTKSEGKSIAAYGAPAKGNTLLNYCHLTNKELACAVEINWLKVNRYTPGSHLRIYHETEVEPPDYYLVLPWHFVDSIVKKETNFLENAGKFIVPIPKFRVIDKSYNG